MKLLGDGGVGCFTVKNVGLEKSRGARMYFSTNADGGGWTTIPTRSADGILIVGISSAVKEAFAQIPTLGNNIRTYAFGSFPGTVRVSLMVFLGVRGQAGDTAGAYLKRLFKLYDNNRLWKGKTVKVAFPGNSSSNGAAITGYLVGMSTETRDPDVGLQMATLEISTVDPQGVQ